MTDHNTTTTDRADARPAEQMCTCVWRYKQIAYRDPECSVHGNEPDRADAPAEPRSPFRVKGTCPRCGGNRIYENDEGRQCQGCGHIVEWIGHEFTPSGTGEKALRCGALLPCGQSPEAHQVSAPQREGELK